MFTSGPIIKPGNFRHAFHQVQLIIFALSEKLMEFNWKMSEPHERRLCNQRTLGMLRTQESHLTDTR